MLISDSSENIMNVVHTCAPAMLANRVPGETEKWMMVLSFSTIYP